MDFESAKAQARASLEAYVKSITKPSPDKAANMWCCPLCGSGTHKNHTGAFEVIGEHWCCYVCDKTGGDIFDLAQKREKLPDLKSAFRYVFKKLNISLDKSGAGQMQTPKEKQTQAGKRFAHILAKDSATSQGQGNTQQAQAEKESEKQIDFEGFRRGFEQSQAAQEYLTGRGISLDVAKRFNIGFWAKENGLIFPLSADSYTMRRIIDGAKSKYQNPSGQAVSLFNAQSLYNTGYCFICEGVFDALSFETAGFNAVSINSANNPQKLFDYIDTNGARGLACLIIATDFDFDVKDEKPKHAGEDAAAAIQSGLKARGFLSYRLEKYPQECKDANEYLQKAGLDAFKEYAAAQQMNAASLADSLNLEKKDESAASPDNVLALIKQNGTHKKPYANIFVLDDDCAEWAVKLYKETGEAFITVSDFLMLANDKELKAGIAFCCMESTQEGKQIGGKNESIYLVEKANELKLFNVYCNDLRATLEKYDAGNTGDFQRAVNECKARLNAQRIDADKRNKTFPEIDAQILTYNARQAFCPPVIFGGQLAFEKQNLAVIFARSGSGKTVALNCLAVEALEQKRCVIFVTLEEPAKQMVIHLTLRRYAGVALKSGLETLETLNAEKRDPIKECYAMWQKAAAGKPLTEIELAMKRARDWVAGKMQTGALRIGEHETTGQIEQYLRATAREGDIVLIDYLQIAKPQESERDRFARVETVSHELTAIAKSQGVTMIVAAQANRNGAGSTDSDGNTTESLASENIRDSDALFQDAAVVIGIGAKYGDSEKIQARFFSNPKNRFQGRDTRYLKMNHALGFAFLEAMKDENGELVVLKKPKPQKDAGSKSGKGKPKGKEVAPYEGGAGKVDMTLPSPSGFVWNDDA